MSKAQALIVDDETDILDLVSITCARMDIGTLTASNLAEAHRLLGGHRFDFCLTDMRLPDGDGTDLVRHIAEHHPDTPVAMITAYGDMDTAVTAMKAGAFDFVSKPLDLRILRDLIGAALRLQSPPTISPDSETPESGLLGTSPQMNELRTMIHKLARNQAPVFVSGESGTGKELVARLIHEQGPRAESAFVPVNCGAIPAELIESELFGHRRGSFTGAVADKAGLFQSAAGLSVASRRSRSITVSSARATATLPERSSAAISARTCSTASMSSTSLSRRCESVPRTSRSSPSTYFAESRKIPAAHQPRCRRRRHGL
jgi:two-component system response regulator PilR (NtrC family)